MQKFKMSPEWTLLLCAIADSDPPSLEGVHWPDLLRLAKAHRVSTSLHSYFRKHGIPIPEPLSATILHNQKHMLALWSATHRVYQQFAQHHIAAIALKGPLLSLYLHQDLAFRTSGDIDILISKDDIQKAHKVLTQMGFVSQFSAQPTIPTYFLSFSKDLGYKHPEKRVYLELHWDWELPPFQPSISFDRALNQSLTLPQSTVPVLCGEHLFVYLCVHANKHYWRQLQLLVDIHTLVLGMTAAQLSEDLQAVRDPLAKRACLVGLSLCHMLAQTPLPPAILDQINTSQIRSLTRKVYPLIFKATESRTFTYLLDSMIFQLSFFDSPRHLWQLYSQAIKGMYKLTIAHSFQMTIMLTVAPFILVQRAFKRLLSPKEYR